MHMHTHNHIHVPRHVSHTLLAINRFPDGFNTHPALPQPNPPDTVNGQFSQLSLQYS